MMTVWLRKDSSLNAASVDKIILEIAVKENHEFLSFVYVVPWFSYVVSIYTTRNTKHDVEIVIFESILTYSLV